MNILLTRPGHENAPLARRLRTAGHMVFISPLLRIEPFAQAANALHEAAIKGVIFTSVNGVRYAPKDAALYDVPAFCVGRRTAMAARKAGWKTVLSADGNAQDLAKLIAEDCDPGTHSLLHYCGENRQAALADSLKRAGFTLFEQVVYTARPVTTFSKEAQGILRAGQMDLVLLYSPRSAAQFRKLAMRDLSANACAGITLGVFSKAVAEAAGPSWLATIIADAPNESSLLKQLDRHYAGALLERGE